MFDWSSVIIAGISAVSGTAVGVFTARQKSSTENLAVVASKDEVVLVHYDKIVDQLQEEITSLRKENDDLRKHNLQLEKDMLEMHRHIFLLTRELTDLKNWVSRELGKKHNYEPPRPLHSPDAPSDPL